MLLAHSYIMWCQVSYSHFTHTVYIIMLFTDTLTQ